MKYFYDGEQISERMAFLTVQTSAPLACMDLEDAAAYWKRRATDEEAREMLSEITDGYLEIIATD